MRHLGIEGYRIDPQLRRLLSPTGEPVAMTGKAFDVLLYLVEHRDRVVSKDDLLAAVWPGRVIEENTLTQAISLARRALGSNAGDPRHIVTVPGRGYRFVAEVRELDPAASESLIAGEPAALSPPAPTAQAASPIAPLPSPPARRRASLVWLLAVFVAVGLLALVLWRREAPVNAEAPAGIATVAGARPLTLAVLPFRALGGGPRDEGLELGMADTLITRLSRTGGLEVRALTSSQRVPMAPLDAQSAGRALGAAYLIEGTTQRVGDDVRINARLLSAADGRVVWADTFDAPIGRVFTVQDRMGTAVTAALKLAPARGAGPRGESPCDGADPVAYRAYLRGQYQNNRPSADRTAEALAAFREAVDRDPSCARAWAGMAFAYRAMVMTGDADPRELFPLAKAAVDRALAIDPDSAEAWSSKGFIEFWYDWDWARSETSLQRAIALNPNLAEAQMAMAHLLVNTGRAKEALPFARRAIALDPLSPLINSLGSFFLRTAGEKEQAGKLLQKTLELEPDAWIALRLKAARAVNAGKPAEAVDFLRRAAEISSRHANTVALLGKAYLKAGDRAAAERLMAELESRRAKGYLPATSLAELADALGQRDRALDLLEAGFRERDVRMSFLLLDWPQLGAEPRYLALLDRMRLPRPKVGPDARQEHGP